MFQHFFAKYLRKIICVTVKELCRLAKAAKGHLQIRFCLRNKSTYLQARN